MEMSYGEEGVGPTLTSRPLHVGIFAPLPIIEGVRPLSVSDIKQDLREIEQNLYDGESDGSVLSDDILTAKFPVKPRKTFKIPKNPPPAPLSDEEKEPVVEESLDQAMMFLNNVETSFKQIADAESKRSALDVTFQAIKDAYLLRVHRFSDSQKQYGNYFRALQAITAQAVQVYTLYNRRNAILCDILEALRRRRASIAQMSSAPDSKPHTHAGEVFEYRVTINGSVKEGGDEAAPVPVTITLYKGQFILTLMGEGTIIRILPAEMKLVVQLLGFGGVLYVNIKTYLAYALRKFGSGEACRTPGMVSRLIDQASTESLLERWRVYEKQLHLSDLKESKIHAVLTEDSAVAPSSTTAAAPTEFTPTLRAILGRNSICVALNDPDAESSESESDDDSVSRSASSDTLDNNSSDPGASAADSAEADADGGTDGSVAADAEGVVEEHESAHFHELERGVLPLVYTPVASMSNVVDAMINDLTNPVHVGHASAKICKRAFGAKTSSGLDISTDLSFLRRSLQRLYKEVHDVEEHQTAIMKEIEQVSANTAELTQRTMCERMHLLTARGPTPGPFGLLKGSRTSKAKTVANVSGDATVSELAGTLLSRTDASGADSEAESEAEEVPVVPVSTRSSRTAASTAAPGGIADENARTTNQAQTGTKTPTSANKPPNGRTPSTTALTNMSTENIISGSRSAKRGTSEISKSEGADDDSDVSSSHQRRIRSRK